MIHARNFIGRIPCRALFFIIIIGTIQASLFSFTSFEVYTMKPVAWEDLYIYTWDIQGQADAQWPGIRLPEPCSEGWYSYTIERPLAGLIFTAGADGPQTEDLLRNSEGWYSISSNRWYDSPPRARIVLQNTGKTVSPRIDGRTTTFSLFVPAWQVFVAGDFSGWKMINMEEREPDLWEVTLEVEEGTFGYAFAVQYQQEEEPVWSPDPANPESLPGPYGYDSTLYIPGFSIEVPHNLSTREPVHLKAYLGEDLVSANWTIEPEHEGVFIEDTVFQVQEKYRSKLDGEIFTLTAQYKEYSESVRISLYENLYRFTINYYRYDENYHNWNLWIWIDGEDGAGYSFNRGIQNDFYQASYFFPSSVINVLPRRGHWEDQKTGRRVQIQEGHHVEVWIIQDVEEVYYSMKEADTSPRIFAALLDAPDTLNVALSSNIQKNQLGKFRLRRQNNTFEIPITVTKVPGHSRLLKIKIHEPDMIDVRDLYVIESEDFTGSVVIMRSVLDDEKYYHDDWLGVRYSQQSSCFRLWTPTALKVSLALYAKTTPEEYDRFGNIRDHSQHDSLHEMERFSTGTWETNVKKDLHGKYYMYKIEFADGTVHYAKDPYARSCAPNGQRSAIINLRKTDPQDWKNTERPEIEKFTDSIIYELHVRDFSISDDSGISEKHRGKYLAFTEEGSRGPGGVSTGIDHLKELGITHVHLLPVYDFRSVNELTIDDPDSDDPKFNWGYDPHNFNVPEGSYATDVWNPAVRIREFKKMVQALHSAGIHVIKDVVYNHTYEIDNGPFEKIIPGYYYRTDESGRFTNGSGCGNEVASERPMVRKYIIDSVRYWAEEYAIDGFRFDLMGIIDIETMEKLVRMLHEEFSEHMLIYGEPWAAAYTPLPRDMMTLKGSQRGKNFAVFNGHFLNAIKGGTDDRSKGFATCQHELERAIISGITGALDDFADCPTETINYVTCHDNLALWDKIIRTRHLEEKEGFIQINEGRLIGEDAEKYRSIEEAVRNKTTPYHELQDIEERMDIMHNETVRRSILANGIVLTSQGIPFLHAGVETLRTKYGDHNSYRSPDIINALRWHRKEDFKPVFDYYQGLIKLRRNHPAFRLDEAELIRKHIKILKAEDKIVAFKISGKPDGETWNNIIVIYNADGHDTDFILPDKRSRNLVVNHKQAGIEIIRTIEEDTIKVPKYSMAVLYDAGE